MKSHVPPSAAGRLGRRRMLRAAAGGGLAALTLAAAPRASVALAGLSLAGDRAFPADVERALDAILARYTAPGTNPGVVAGVWIPGRGTWERAVGLGDVATGTPIALGDAVRIASNTKTFVGTAVLQLVDEGRLALDDHLDRYVTDIANGDRITIRHLLNMTAGVFNYVEDAAFLAAYDADPLLPFSPPDALPIIRRHEPYFAPGEGFHYSDSQYILLGLIVEQVTGRPLPEVIEQRVVAPLGLGRTSFPTTPPLPPPFARGYLGGGEAGPLVDITLSNPNVAWAAGAMLSNLADMRIWATSLASGALLRPETQRERLTWVPIAGAPGASYGLGIADFGGFIGHNGGIFGYSTIAAHQPESDATIVVLVNRGGTEGGDADAIFAAIVGVLFPGGVRR